MDIFPYISLISNFEMDSADKLLMLTYCTHIFPNEYRNKSFLPLNRRLLKCYIDVNISI